MPLQSTPTPLQRPIGNESAVMYQPSRTLQFALRDSILTSNLTQTLSSLANKTTVVIEHGAVELPNNAISSGAVAGGFIGVEGDGLLLTSGPGEIPLGGTGILSWQPVGPNVVLAGPAVSGFNVIPTFRALVNADMPTSGAGSGSVTSFSSGNLSPLFTTSVATATSTPALSFTLSSVAQNSAFLGPLSGSGVPTFRAITAADLPGGSIVNSVANSDGTLTISPTTGAVIASLALGNANSWTGTQTFATITPTTISGAANFSGTPTFAAGAGLGTGTYSGAAVFSGAVNFTGTPVFSTITAGKVVIGGTGGSLTDSVNLTFTGSTLTVGLAGTSSGTLSLAGSTSGTATLTAPAVAGTATNPIAISNSISLGGGITSIAAQATAGALGITGVVYSVITTGLTALVANATVYTTTAAGMYRVSGVVYPTTLSSSAWQIYPVATAIQNVGTSSVSNTIGNVVAIGATYFIAINEPPALLVLASGATIGISTLTNSGSNTGGVYNLGVTIERIS
jgi:hypothetical protein